MSDAQTVRSWKDGPRTPWAVMGLAITTLGGILTAYLARPTVPADCASRGDMNALQKQVSDLDATQRTLTQTIARNADVAHNETTALTTEVRVLVNSLAVQGTRADPRAAPMGEFLRK